MKFSAIAIKFCAISTAAVMFSSCGGDSSKEDSEGLDTAVVAEVKTKTQKVFFAIPSPLEIANLIKKSGANFDKTILNPVANASKYTTQAAMAINLGIYGADLSYTSIFDQTQESLKYMQATKKMADGLGIGDALSEEALTRLEKNSTNKDSLLQIVSDSYYNTDAFLKENDKGHISSLVIAGGWIEGLYISTKIAEKSTKNQDIVKHIADQKLTIENLRGLLETSQSDESVKALLADINALNEIFGTLKAEEVTAKEAPKSEGVTTLGGDEPATEIKVSKEQLATISAKVLEIRTKLVK
jgi:hypothetical protein